jgi:hypothetical protein
LLGGTRRFRRYGIGRRLVLEAETGASDDEFLTMLQNGLADSYVGSVGALEIDEAPSVLFFDERLPQFGVAAGNLGVVGNDQVAFRSANDKPLFSDSNQFAILRAVVTNRQDGRWRPKGGPKKPWAIVRGSRRLGSRQSSAGRWSTHLQRTPNVILGFQSCSLICHVMSSNWLIV